MLPLTAVSVLAAFAFPVVVLTTTTQCSAQRVLFAETFDAGIPASWSHVALDAPIDPWSPGADPITASPDVFHEWFCHHGGVNRKNLLVSPPIDLGDLFQATFSCSQHQMFPTQRSLNRVQVSIDGGTTFTPLYDETGTWSGHGTITLSLDAFTGNSDVRIGFLYEGAVANEWRIDDVEVTTMQPALGALREPGGATVRFRTNTAPASVVVLLVSANGGATPTPFGPLALLLPAWFTASVVASPRGSAAIDVPLPPVAGKVLLQAQAIVLEPSGVVRLTNRVVRSATRP